jgi:glycosyltransferase involved in cell wall biosynthesis
MKTKLVRITTIPLSLEKLLSGQLEFMSPYYEITAVSSEKENLEKLGKSIDVATFHVEMTRQITPLKDVLALLKLFFFLLKTKPSIVHTHTPKAGIVGMLAAKLAGVPHRFHTVAGLPLLVTSGSKRKILDVIEKITYSCATKVYPNSFGLLQIIKDNNYCNSNKLKVLANGSSNGIDTSYFSRNHFSEQDCIDFKLKLGIKEDEFVFVFIGRLVADKGINELVVTFLKLLEQNPKCKLLLFGPDDEVLNPLKPEVLYEIKNNSSIISFGYIDDVRPYLAVSNALVFPSYREGFPNVVMQAGAMELPCIVSDINGCNEIITNNINGLIIPVKNEMALSNAMTKLLLDTVLYTKLKNNARKIIVDSYEQKIVWEAILSEYKKT